MDELPKPSSQEEEAPTQHIPQSTNSEPPKWQILTSVAIGILLILISLIFILFNENPTNNQLEYLRMTFALGAACLSAIFIGFIQVEGKFLDFALKGGGAFGIFLIIYFLDPTQSVEPSFNKEAYTQENHLKVLDQQIKDLDHEISEKINEDISTLIHTRNELLTQKLEIEESHKKKQSTLEMVFDYANQLSSLFSNKQLRSYQKHIEKGDLNSADQFLTQAFKIQKNQPQDLAKTLFQRGKIALEKLEYDSAHTFLKNACQLNPTNDIYLDEYFTVCETLSLYDELKKHALKIKNEIEKKDQNARTLTIAYLMLAVAEYKFSNHKKSIEYTHQAKAFDQFIANNKNKFTSSIYTTLGANYLAMANYKKAIENFNASKSKDLNNLPSYSLDNYYNNMGAVYAKQGDFTQSIKYLKKTVQVAEEKYPKFHPKISFYYYNLAEAYAGIDDFENGINFAKLSIQQYHEVFGEQHPKLANPYQTLSNIYFIQRKYLQAETQIQKALHINKRIFGDQSAQVANDLNTLGAIYVETKEFKKANEILKNALTLTENILGEDHPRAASIHNNLGALYSDLRAYSLSEKHYLKSLKIDSEKHISNHPSLMITRMNLGLTYKKMRKYQEAIKYFKANLNEIYQPNLKPSKAARLHFNIGNSYEALHNHELALEHYNHSIYFYKLANSKHPEIQKISKMIQRVQLH